MPYVKEGIRKLLETCDPLVAGELNYAITELIIAYVKNHGLNYQTCNDIVGALDNAKHEFRRRIQDPYENRAIQRNGDVYADLIV